MQTVTDRRRVTPEDVGQSGPTDEQNRTGFGGFLRANMLTWIAVFALAAAFAVAIIIAA